MADNAGPIAAQTIPGSLVMADRVAQKIAERVCLEVPDVLRHRGGVSLLGGVTGPLGGEYPDAQVEQTPTSLDVRIKVVLRWPSRISAVCRQLRDHVAEELARLTGVRPGRVDVTVVALVADDKAAERRRSGMIELPSVPADSGLATVVTTDETGPAPTPSAAAEPESGREAGR